MHVYPPPYHVSAAWCMVRAARLTHIVHSTWLHRTLDALALLMFGSQGFVPHHGSPYYVFVD